MNNSKKNVVFQGLKYFSQMALFLFIIFLSQSCSESAIEKEYDVPEIETCGECKRIQMFANDTIIINAEEYPVYSDGNKANINVTLLSKFYCNSVSELITEKVKEFGISGLTIGSPLASCVFYSGEINTENSDSVVAILVYDMFNFENRANLWVKNQNGHFVHNESISGRTSLFTKSDMYRINHLLGLNAKNLLILLDESKLVDHPHWSIFQNNIRKMEIANSTLSRAPSAPPCGSCCMDPLCSWPPGTAGECIIQERQNGPPSGTCVSCSISHAVNTLEDENYSVEELLFSDVYKIRDEFLVNSLKGLQYIEDYYYASDIIGTNINLSMALKLYDLYNLSFFHNLSLFDDPNHQSDIVVTNQIKVLVLNLCTECRSVSSDTRFNSIIDKVENDIIAYEGLPLSSIIADF